MGCPPSSHLRTFAVNPATLCAPLGASVVFAGISKSIPLLHGAQGCATYIRRYLISHFREPVDIASSSFSETSTILGASGQLTKAIDNIIRQYNPELIGIATTCLAETIGEDVPGILASIAGKYVNGPRFVTVSTPSFRYGHSEGFWETSKAVVEQLVRDEKRSDRIPSINVFPAMVSPEDLRHLRHLCGSFGIDATILPDYSDTLDRPALDHYELLGEGKTTVSGVQKMASALASLQLSRIEVGGPARILDERLEVPARALGLPIGLRETDHFMNTLAEVTGTPIPDALSNERGRLIDAYVDGHKYLMNRTAAVYGDPDLVLGLVSFLLEIGITPSVIATGGRFARRPSTDLDAANDLFVEQVRAIDSDRRLGDVTILTDTDYSHIEAAIEDKRPTLMIGTSKGYRISKKLSVPLIRVGFPIHDRIGASRVLHVGYQGALRLYDEITNAILHLEQERSPIGFSYM